MKDKKKFKKRVSEIYTYTCTYQRVNPWPRLYMYNVYICKYTGALMPSSLTSNSTEQEASRTQTLQYYTILYRTNRSHDMT